jgi:hypothetical protein
MGFADHGRSEIVYDRRRNLAKKFAQENRLKSRAYVFDGSAGGILFGFGDFSE